jgi:hypothetical protein
MNGYGGFDVASALCHVRIMALSLDGRASALGNPLR